MGDLNYYDSKKIEIESLKDEYNVITVASMLDLTDENRKSFEVPTKLAKAVIKDMGYDISNVKDILRFDDELYCRNGNTRNFPSIKYWDYESHNFNDSKVANLFSENSKDIIQALENYSYMNGKGNYRDTIWENTYYPHNNLSKYSDNDIKEVINKPLKYSFDKLDSMPQDSNSKQVYLKSLDKQEEIKIAMIDFISTTTLREYQIRSEEFVSLNEMLTEKPYLKGYVDKANKMLDNCVNKEISKLNKECGKNKDNSNTKGR